MKSCGDEMGRVKENQRERIKLCQKLLPDSLEIEIIIIMDSKWILPPLLLPPFSLTSTQPIQLKPSSLLLLQLLLPFIPPFIHHPNFSLSLSLFLLLLLLSTLPLSLYTVSFSLSIHHIYYLLSSLLTNSFLFLLPHQQTTHQTQFQFFCRLSPLLFFLSPTQS